MLAGIQGAPFMVRIALALKSGLISELDWALHHLVRLSYEQGNNLRFDRIPDLAETLIKKLYEFLKQVSGKDGTMTHENIFNEDSDDWSMDHEFTKTLDKMLEAALILRNLALLSDNASYLARLEMTLPTLVLGIQKMNDFSSVELKHYCMDIIEASNANRRPKSPCTPGSPRPQQPLVAEHPSPRIRENTAPPKPRRRRTPGLCSRLYLPVHNIQGQHPKHTRARRRAGPRRPAGQADDVPSTGKGSPPFPLNRHQATYPPRPSFPPRRDRSGAPGLRRARQSH
ncbi:unnamed protein product [Pneumocystis jirovecii]|uniref:SWI/SNF-like complex subunit BAF250 C-terminal domain-containing protein n=1 Tax=Pneumocystis jirovecii TaxID=42068 RepID=L0PGB5_PNEJI|nr:unnamed protein product [Pneumocystis jirovecii]